MAGEGNQTLEKVSSEGLPRLRGCSLREQTDAWGWLRLGMKKGQQSPVFPVSQRMDVGGSPCNSAGKLEKVTSVSYGSWLACGIHGHKLLLRPRTQQGSAWDQPL